MFKSSTRESFATFKELHDLMPRRWKVLVWGVLIFQTLIMITSAVSGDWFQVFDTFCSTMLFALCVFFMLIIVGLNKIIDGQFVQIKAQNALIDNLLEVRRGK